ncbi:ABC transporter permease [Angustibacter sp. McL0619]|uniref:ABC transporter permease n=1 Tax=Angustibacter sp. McL0619 TaxID=3415676 RepID=UPI003CF13FD1
MSTGTTTEAPPTGKDAAELAARYGLSPMGIRPGLIEYIGQLWSRRYFVSTLATSRAYARHEGNYLGQLWSVLTPMLNAAVYYFIFGVLLGTSRGVDNFPAFLVIGVFLFRFTTSSIISGSRSLLSNTSLLRSLHFPRAVLPAANVMAELAHLGPAILVMVGITVITGEQPKWTWLLLPFVIAMQWLFNTGMAFMVARATVRIPDLTNLLPFTLRLLMYVSGVFFSVDHYVGDTPLGHLMTYQPVAVYLSLARGCLLDQFTPEPVMWAFGFGWAVLFLVGGFVLFWRGEETYGRD